MSDSTPAVKPAELLRAEAWQFEYRQKSSPVSSNLDLLTYGVYRIAPCVSSEELFHRDQQAHVLGDLHTLCAGEHFFMKE